MNIDACSSCLKRIDSNDVNGLNNCCYRICSSFLGGPDNIIHTECAQNCKKCVANAVCKQGRNPCKIKPAMPFIELQQQNFKHCLNQTQNDKEMALKCCMMKANNNTEQQDCIDAYNSLIQVREGYIAPRNKCFMFFICMLILQTLLLTNKIPLYDDLKTNLLYVNGLICIIYFVLFYIL
jgi:hypothetical protein